MSKEILWGYAGVFPGEFRIWDGDQTMNTLEFMVKHGFKSTGINLKEMEIPTRREQIAEFVATHSLELTPGLHGIDFIGEDPDGVRRKIDDFLENLRRYGGLLQAPLTHTGVGRYHRFMRSPSLPEQLDRLTEVLTPVAAACFELGFPLAIENHGDYYCSDLVELCRRVPHLYFFLDTGNTYLIGEQSVPACKLAAPYTIGTHFKDHFVRPNPQNLTFVIEGAPLGEGDVGLREIFATLLKEAPMDKLVMQWEMIPPPGMDPYLCLERSWDFVRSLEVK